jgi:hypothetical protein
LVDSEYKYKKCGVAYLDILGFTPKVQDVRQDSERLQRLAVALDAMDIVLRATAANKANVHMFSDTIVLTFPKPSQIPLYGMAYLSILQVWAAARGFFLRGGIAHGDHYEKGRVMFGPAYLNAYGLEKSALWPRVLVHPSVLEIDPSPLFPWGSLTVHDGGVTFVDHLQNAFVATMAFEWAAEYSKRDDFLLLSSKDLFPSHRAAIIKEAAEVAHDAGVLSKYHELAKYHNSVIQGLVDMLQGWHSDPADTLRRGSHSRKAVDLFLAAVHPKPRSEDEKASAVHYLANKMDDLAEVPEYLADAIIDLPSALPALSAATQKAL